MTKTLLSITTILLSALAASAQTPPASSLTTPPRSSVPAAVIRPNQAQAPVDRPVSALLKAGTPAPDFSALAPNGKPVKLSDFKGKVVILDFWATWCGPCKVSMPGLEKIYAQVKDQNVVVLSLCVWDEQKLFDTFVAANFPKIYSFTFAFDPAGRAATNIAAKLYGVQGIPTMYIIDRDGKVNTAIVGSGNEKNITQALKSLNIKVPAE